MGWYTLSEEAIQYKVYQVNDGEKDILIAIDEEYGGNFQVTFNQASGKYYQFFEMHTNGSPGQSLPGSSNSGSANQNAAANRIHDSYINAGRGNDIILAGQGRDTIEGGRGDDFIDGGSESDFLATLSAATAGGTAIKNQLIENPDTGKKSLYSIYDGGLSMVLKFVRMTINLILLTCVTYNTTDEQGRKEGCQFLQRSLFTI